MKGGSVLRTVSFYARNCLLRLPTTITKTPPPSSLIPLASSSRTGLSFYSSGRSVPSEIHEKNDPADSADDVTGKELKKRVEKYFDGDEEAIPSIFEAILERKLAKLEGKLDEKDEELVEKIFGKREELHGDSEDHEDFESESDSDSD
ncbi:uncharacterized protein LOC107418600 [Ziziphus jujuba]|uniref:Uncharacterized protein LOC107418600 n=1 Tax=Ziziphus jujuba TaxID=326968 RepID=A0A6P4AAN8_ZIZJJ|nr:uncharacterized protein LOC107418600 [Ziziphus jujuba]XP_060670775.1 uncharacterized protein LOC107418600 [Ziziphus jujuba]